MKETKQRFSIRKGAMGVASVLIGLSLLGTGVYAQETGGTTSVETSTQSNEEKLSLMKVFSIDAGRKYFSLDQLKEIIDKLQKEGYTDLHLLLGNDGMRFLLDDMTITTDTKTYTSQEVKDSIQAGNNYYYNDPNGNTLTQDEMEELLNYARERRIRVIPAINSPGHMDGILHAMTYLGIPDVYFQYNGRHSLRTVDLDQAEAVQFTKELIKKYAHYFSGKVYMFNIGLDEYANDATDAKGWNVLQQTGKYGQFVQYANDLAKIVKDAKMMPIAFNDGIYYNHDESNGTFDQDIVVSYWTGGWGGYDVASSKFLSDKGHSILNTNDAWYYVIGRDTANGGYYNLEQGLNGTNNHAFDSVLKSEGEKITTIGSMVAVWADDPSREYNKDNVFRLLSAFSEKNPTYFEADYTELLEELRLLPRRKDLENYSDESVKNLNDALKTIDWTLNKTQQDQVTQIKDAIKQAREALVLKETPKDESSSQEVKPEQPKDESSSQEVKPEQPKDESSSQEVKPEQPKDESSSQEVKPEQPKDESSSQEVKPEQPKDESSKPDVKPEQPKDESSSQEVKPEQPKDESSKPDVKPEQPKDQEQTLAEKTAINLPKKSVVLNAVRLNNREKAMIKQAIEKANPNLPLGTRIIVDNQGRVALIYPDNSIKELPAKTVLIQKSVDFRKKNGGNVSGNAQSNQQVDYSVTKGQDARIVKGDKLTVTANIPFEKFVSVYVDGEELDEKWYTANEGSTVITLSSEFTKTLQEGKHSLRIVATDGQANSHFYVENTKKTAGKYLPNTGSQSMLVAGLFGLCSLIGSLFIYKKPNE